MQSSKEDEARKLNEQIKEAKKAHLARVLSRGGLL